MKGVSTVVGALLLVAGPALAAELPPGPGGDLSDATCAYAAKASARPTLVSYIGSPEGAVTNVTLQQSSGDPLQDAAVADCVRHWHFDPASPLGKLLIGRQYLNVGWLGGETVLRRLGIPHICSAFYPADLLAAHISGTTTLRFTITAEGRVSDTSVLISSGAAGLDDASIACARNWRYRPAIKDGQPIAVPWKVEVKWVVPAPNPAPETLPVPIVN